MDFVRKKAIPVVALLGSPLAAIRLSATLRLRLLCLIWEVTYPYSEKIEQNSGIG